MKLINRIYKLIGLFYKRPAFVLSCLESCILSFLVVYPVFSRQDMTHDTRHDKTNAGQDMTHDTRCLSSTSICHAH